MLDTIRTDREDYIQAFVGSGLGVRVDWAAMKSATLVALEQTMRGLQASNRA